MNSRPLVFVFVRHFYPGYKFGGPTQSVLGSILNYKIARHVVITLDRDYLGPRKYGPAYRGIRRLAGSVVDYVPSLLHALVSLRRKLRRRPFATVYFQSVFDIGWSLLPLLLVKARLIPGARVVVAPRGELSEGALSVKPLRKMLFLSFVRAFGIYRSVSFQATCDSEVSEILAAIGSCAKVTLLRNLPATVPSAEESFVSGRSIPLRVVYISRVTRKKNLALLLPAIQDLNIRLRVCGPVDDQGYYAELGDEIEARCLGHKVEFVGSLDRAAVQAELRNSDVFVLPTLGENFGHAIFEALASGVPVITSHFTPWKDLRARKAGWNVSISDPAELRDALGSLVSCSDAEFRALRMGAVRAAASYLASSKDSGAFMDLMFEGRGNE